MVETAQEKLFRKLEESVPTLKEQRERFTEVFGAEAAGKIEAQAEAFRRRGTGRAGGSPFPTESERRLAATQFESFQQQQAAKAAEAAAKERARLETEKRIAEVRRQEAEARKFGERRARQLQLERAQAAERKRQAAPELFVSPGIRERIERTAPELFQERRVFEVTPSAAEQEGIPPPTLELVKEEKKGTLAATQQRISARRQELTTRTAREGTTFIGETESALLGALAGAAGTLAFGKKLITEPKETITSVPGGLKTSAEFVTTGQLATLIRAEPGFVTGAVAGEIAEDVLLGKIAVGIAEDITKVATRLDPGFRKVVTKPTGVQIIEDIPSLEKRAFKFGDGGITTTISVSEDVSDVLKPISDIDIGLIPKGTRPRLSVDPKAVVKQTDIPLKKKPSIPKLDPISKQVFDVAVKEDDLFTGSFAQKGLVEDSRKFADIDIVSEDIFKTARAIEQQVPSVKVTKKTITDSPLGEFDIFKVTERRTGRGIADIDPLKFAEEGLARKFEPIDVAGARFVDPKARLQAKLLQLQRGKVGKQGKVLRDINILTASEFDPSSPLVRGAFGFTQAEQKALIGRRGPVTTSARDLFKRFEPDVVIDKPFFVSPFDPKTEIALTRKTRLGLETDLASITDILSGEFTLRRPKPQIVTFKDQVIGKEFKITPGSEFEALVKDGLIRKKGKLGVTIIEGKRVPIFEAELGKASKKLRQLNRKRLQADLGVSDLPEFRKQLRKETGFDVSRIIQTKPFVSPASPIASVTRALKLSKSDFPSLTPSRRPSKRKTRKVTPSPSKALSKALSRDFSSAGISRVTKEISRTGGLSLRDVPSGISGGLSRDLASVFGPPIVPVPVPIIPIEEKAKRKKKGRDGYRTQVLQKRVPKLKQKRKWLNVGLPLKNKGLARDLGAYVTDKSISAQFRVKKVKKVKKFGKPRKAGHFSNTRKKWRDFKIVKGKKKPLTNRYIERREFRLDTLGEKNDLSAAKLIKQELGILPKRKKRKKK